MKGASRGLEGGLRRASRGLQGGLRRASRGLQGGLRLELAVGTVPNSN